MATADEKQAKEDAKQAAKQTLTLGAARLKTEVGMAGRAFAGRSLRAAGDLSRYAIGGFLDDPNAPGKPPAGTGGGTTTPRPRPTTGGGSGSGSGSGTPPTSSFSRPAPAPTVRPPSAFARGVVVSAGGQKAAPGRGAISNDSTPYVNRPTPTQMQSGRDGGLMGNIAGGQQPNDLNRNGAKALPGRGAAGRTVVNPPTAGPKAAPKKRAGQSSAAIKAAAAAPKTTGNTAKRAGQNPAAAKAAAAKAALAKKVAAAPKYAKTGAGGASHR